jgi:hypothetical protein
MLYLWSKLRNWIEKPLKPKNMPKKTVSAAATKSSEVYATRSGKLQINESEYFKSKKIQETVAKLMSSSLYQDIKSAE